VDVIEKSEDRISIVISVGFVFYNERKQKWCIGLNLIDLPVDGKAVRHLYQEVRDYDLRPQGNVIYNDLSELLEKFGRLEMCGDGMVMTNESDGEFRVIAVPDLNLVLIDERNGRISFERG
jgi:hypothetical protein